jgi:hypothetical protein
MLPEKRYWLLALLALLAVLAYLPTLRQPLLEDDYPNLAIAQTYGAPQEWRQLAGSVFRLRATSEWLFYFAYNAFGMHAAPYYAIAILLHVLNTWLVYALGAWRAVGYRVSAWAALFFAVYEGHQEAVMWFSACNELLQFLFGVGAIVCWLHFLDSGKWKWYAGSLAALALALISKESAVVVAGLMLVVGWRRRLPYVAILLAAGCAALVYADRGNSFRFQDGSFSLQAPFWRIWPENFARLFWFWGLLAVIAAWPRYRAVVWRGLVWAGMALLPYSFLLYSARIPSRQVYLASAGLAIIAGAGMTALEKQRRPAAALICVVLMVHNIGYLWIKKRAQFLERAEPTEQLIAAAKRTAGPIYIQCFPRPALIAEEAIHVGAGKPVSDVIWNSEDAKQRGATAWCYAPMAANRRSICCTNK